MTLLTPLLMNPAALALADLIAKAALVVGIASAVTQLLKWRRASAATQHLVWAASVVALIGLPVLTLAAPAWIVEIAQSPAAIPVPADAGSLIDSPQGSAIAPVPQRPAPALASLSLMQLLAGAYLMGMIGLLLRLALGSWSVARLARDTMPVADPKWLALLRDLSWTMGIDRPVRLLQSDDATIPMTWGTRRPHILLPTEASSWPAERRRAVLTHELAHVVRFDCLTQWLASVACAVYWMHPAVWYAARRLRVERERACDDYVIESGVQPREYATELFEVAQKYRRPCITAVAALGMARPSELEGRILSLMDGFRSHHAASGNWIAAVILGTALIMIPIGCVQPGIAQASEIVARAVEPNPVTVQDGTAPQDTEAMRTVASSDSSCRQNNVTYFAFQVDQQAEFIFDSTVTEAPSSTRSGGLAVQFVVDQRGQPELGSFKVLRLTDEAEAERARNAFPQWRFTPALRQGCSVRQLVHVEVVVAARYQGVL